MRAAAIAVIALVVTGCAARPIVLATASPPGIPPEARTFAVAPAGIGEALVPLVEARLRQFGYLPSATHDLIVTVAATERPRGVGAFITSECRTPEWTAQPRRPWLIGGGRVTGLTIRMSDARSGQTFYRATATVRSTASDLRAHAEQLVSSALAQDPRKAPLTPDNC